MLRDQGGLSLVETVIAMLVAGLILPVVGAVFFLMFSVPTRSESGLEGSLETAHALEVISRDGQTAIAYSTPVPAAPLDYGSFYWLDYSVLPPITHTVRYYYDAVAQALVRAETVGGTTSARIIAHNIVDYGDVAIIPTDEAITVALTSTVTSPVSVSGVVSREASTGAKYRSEVPPTGFTFAPSQDAYVDQSKPNANYGETSLMGVRSITPSNANGNERSLLQFDLSKIPGSSIINSAKLRLYMAQAPSSSRTYVVRRVVSSWVENSITWATQPAVATVVSASAVVGTVGEVWVEWDVTGDVQSYADGSLVNFGWIILDQAENSSTNQEARFRTRNDNINLRPRLVVDWTTLEPTPTPTPFGEPQIGIFSAIADASLDSIHSGSNYGSGANLSLGDPVDGVVRFNISSIPTQGTTVTSAVLTMTVTGVAKADDQKLYSLHRVLTDWIENTVTWDSPGSVPGVNYLASVSSSLIITGTRSYTFDVTEDVRSFVNGSATNRGWRIRYESNLTGNSDGVSFGARENGTVVNRPALQVDYIAPLPSPTPTPTPAPTPVVVTLYPTNDSYIDMNLATANYGGNGELHVRSTNTGNPDENRRSLLRFDTSGIPAGANVSSAFLRMFMAAAPSASRSYEVRRALASWTESTVNWTNQPSLNAAASSTSASGTTANVWQEWALTSDVQAFVNGSLQNYGWGVRDAAESAAGNDYLARFYSKEVTPDGFDPQLVVTYQP